MLGFYYQSALDWTPREYDPGQPDGLSTYYGDIPGNLCWDDGYSKWRTRLNYDAPRASGHLGPGVHGPLGQQLVRDGRKCVVFTRF